MTESRSDEQSESPVKLDEEPRPLRPPLRDPASGSAQLEAERPVVPRPERRRESDRRKEPMDPAIKAAIRVGKLHRKRYSPSPEQEKRMVRAYRASIVLRRKPGVKADPKTKAGADVYLRFLEGYRSRRPGASWRRFRDRVIWPAVYRMTITGFEKMDLADRQYYSARVRNNVKAYLKRRGVNLSPGKRNRRLSRRSNRGESNTPD